MVDLTDMKNIVYMLLLIITTAIKINIENCQYYIKNNLLPSIGEIDFRIQKIRLQLDLLSNLEIENSVH